MGGGVVRLGERGRGVEGRYGVRGLDRVAGHADNTPLLHAYRGTDALSVPYLYAGGGAASPCYATTNDIHDFFGNGVGGLDPSPPLDLDILPWGVGSYPPPGRANTRGGGRHARRGPTRAAGEMKLTVKYFKLSTRILISETGI